MGIVPTPTVPSTTVKGREDQSTDESSRYIEKKVDCHDGDHPECRAGDVASSWEAADEDPAAQLLRLETITDREARVVTANIKAIAGLCIAGIIVLAVLKTTSRASELFVLNRSFHVASVIVGAACVASLTMTSAIYAHRIATSLRARRTWSRHRAVPVALTCARGAAMLVVAGTYTASHAMVLADPGALCRATGTTCLGALRWVAYNCILLSSVVEVHCLVPIRSTGGRITGAVGDQGWRPHWLALVLWTAVTGARESWRRQLCDPNARDCSLGDSAGAWPWDAVPGGLQQLPRPAPAAPSAQ